MKTIRFMTLFAVMLLNTVIMVHAQSIKDKNHPQSIKSKESTRKNLTAQVVREDMVMAKAAIAEILKDKIEIFDKTNQVTDDPKDLIVLDDRIEFRLKHRNTILLYSEIVDDSIPPPYYDKTKIVLELEKFNFVANGWASRNMDRLEELRHHLIFIQGQFEKKQYSSQLVLFEPVAAQYRALNVKPFVTEEQRKYIVQANLFNEKKMYGKAIEMYKKVVELDKTAYPAGYYNLALLSAQIERFDAAIYYMNKYLLLMPDAQDARAAHDKIYEWEALTSN